jgi:Holliday junction resolvase RusA-like endonuclease
MIRVILPHPPRELRPNSKHHWAVKAKAGKKHKGECYMLARVRKKDVPKDKDLYINLTFHPRTNHKIDRDNALASMKWALDGIAAAWDMDDSRFIPFVEIGCPKKGGQVVMEVTAK